jgi:hypothetical protein
MDVQLNHALGDAAQVRAAMQEADIVSLLLVLAHLGGDEAMLDEAAPYIQRRRFRAESCRLMTV